VSGAPPSAPDRRFAAIDTRRFPLALYPALLAGALVVELGNVAGVSPFAVVRSFTIAVIAALVLSWLGRLSLRDRDRGGVAAALWVLALLGADDLRLAGIILLATILLGAEAYLLPQAKRTIRWARIGRAFSAVAAILALAVLIQAVQLGAVSDAIRSLRYETALRPVPPRVVGSADPDIYMVLVDGHARPDVVESVYGGDQRAFLEALASKGYLVAPRSRSNYTQTLETLSSFLNQAQLAEIDRMDGLLAGTEGRPAGTIARNVINDNVTFAFLRARGYEIGAISSGFEQAAMREADWFVDTGQITEFEIGLLRRSVLNHVLSAVARDVVSAQQRARIQATFEALSSTPARPGERPRFVFGHVPSPHVPWVFHADGSPRTVADLESFYAETPASTGLSQEELADAYRQQIVDNDRRLLAALDQLERGIDVRGRPAVVVVFSDHGSWVYADGGDIRLRFKNLLAVRATDVALDLEPNLTLVNLLPSLFEQIYGVEWVRRPDTQYRFGPRDSYQLIEVADPDAVATP
jgi:hypothetical protein